MNVLLTGANGFFGKVIPQAFTGHNLITLGLSDCNINANLAKDFPTLPKGIDMVIHAAGKAHTVPHTEEEKQAFYDVNVKGTLNLLFALDAAGTRPGTFFFISTVAVYGIETGENIPETAPLLGDTPYAISKIKAEQIILDWGAKNKVQILILRLPLLIGAGAPGNLGSMMKAIQKGYYFRIGDGSARRSMVLAEDVSRFIAGLAGKSGIYTLTDGYHPSFRELEEVIAAQTGKRIRTIPAFLANAAAKAGDIIPGFPINSLKLSKLTQSLTFSDAKARAELGWNPRRVIDNFRL